MKIHLRQIPYDGAHYEGEENCPLPELKPDEARCAGPLRYDFDAGISEGALWVKGTLAQPLELRCVRCLESFPFTLSVPNFTVHTDLAGPEEIDLTPFMREDLLLNLPAYPHCDREGGRICPAPVAEVASDGGKENRPTDWSALDGLKIRKR